MQLVIRPADLLSEGDLVQAAQNRGRIEAAVHDSLSKIPLDIGFDWTPLRATPADGFLFVNRDGRPVSLPRRLAALRTAVEQAVHDALEPPDTIEQALARTRRWSARAEAYRATADACDSEAGRQVCLALADRCEIVAHRMARTRKSPPSGGRHGRARRVRSEYDACPADKL